MAAASWFKYAYLAHLSKPKTDRQLYRLVKRHQVCRIVELGINDLRRSLRLIEVAQCFAGDAKVRFTGLDWFDARPSEFADLRLKQTHQLLQPSGAAVRLVPGSPAGSIPAVANAHQSTDLLLISRLVDDADLERAWFYVPRMLHENSLVLREQHPAVGRSTFTQLSIGEVSERAKRLSKRQAA